LRRRHPRSTLFPYTTLFRSEVETAPKAADCRRAWCDETLRERGPRSGCCETGTATSRRADRQEQAPDDRTGSFRGSGGAELASPDRKSTRLNSSHVAISYAV